MEGQQDISLAPVTVYRGELSLSCSCFCPQTTAQCPAHAQCLAQNPHHPTQPQPQTLISLPATAVLVMAPAVSLVSNPQALPPRVKEPASRAPTQGSRHRAASGQVDWQRPWPQQPPGEARNPQRKCRDTMPAGKTLTRADRRKQKPVESSHSPATPPPVTGPFSAAPRPQGLAGDVLGNRAAAVRAGSV